MQEERNPFKGNWGFVITGIITNVSFQRQEAYQSLFGLQKAYETKGRLRKNFHPITAGEAFHYRWNIQLTKENVVKVRRELINAIKAAIEYGKNESDEELGFVEAFRLFHALAILKVEYSTNFAYCGSPQYELQAKAMRKLTYMDDGTGDFELYVELALKLIMQYYKTFNREN